ncbi:MAG: hypothetical protein MI700_09865 [Balneolales bacterium]|nr:hypothetical protein [Balneolales bacterium]
MIEYLIESTFCAAILYVTFLVFFRRSRSYHANRVLLLGSVLFFVLVPLVNVSPNNPVAQQIVQNEAISTTLSGLSTVSGQTITATETLNNDRGFSWLFLLYGSIALLLLARLGMNVYPLLSGKFVVQQLEHKGQRLALVNIPVGPFSFWRTVYINKDRFECGQIDDELILHESGHVRQFHSMDILFMELVQVFCWFNPLIPLFKKLVVTNHEYLADEFVIKAGSDKARYSNKLISYTTPDKTLALASGFNYALIKNRLIMLSKYDQKSRIFYRLPVFITIVAALFTTTAFTSPQKAVSENSGYFYADSLYWSEEDSKVYFRGNVIIKYADNDVSGEGSFSFLGEVNHLYANGTLLKKGTILFLSGEKHEITSITAEEAREKYNTDGQFGAVEIRTTD